MPPKPVVVKKGSFYKTKKVPVILNKINKRQNPNVSVEDNPSAKRLCPDFDTPIKDEIIEIKIEAMEDTPKPLNVLKSEELTVKKEKKKSILGRQFGGVCLKHDEPLFEHQAEGLPQPGDTYPSIEEFTEYITSNAKKWCFYYVRSETRLNKPHGTCVYRCKFFRKQPRIQNTGKRTQKNKQTSLGCPASVHLKRQPNSEVMKVTLVCHHHTHDITKESFDQQPHGYRLPQNIKDEIRDLALLNVHPALIRKYVESIVPDLNLGKTVINTVIKLRHDGITKDILSPQRMSEMLEKIRYIKANFDISLMSSSRGKITPFKKKTIMVKKADPKPSFEPKTTPKRKRAQDDSDNEESEQTAVTDDDITIERLEYDSQTEDEVDRETSVDSEGEQYTTFAYTSDGEVIELEDNNGLSLINPSTGDFEYSQSEIMLINPETGLLDTKAEETEDQAFVKQYKIGDISIVCTESVDDSGNSTVVLNHIQNSRGGLTVNNVKKQLSKVEKSICQPINYSPKAECKRMPKRKSKGDPVEEAKTRCMVKHGELPEQQAKGLIQIGNKFSSIDELLSYAASYASQWYFYYHVYDSRNTKGADRTKPILYNLNCRFNKGFYKSKSKGLRRVKQNTINCPAALNLRRGPGEDKFTVTYVCHHHSHELSAELFGKEAHGHRLPQELKDEIKVLAWYKLDSRLIKQYLEDLTGLKMGKTIKNIVAALKKKNVKVEVQPEKMTEILEKIKDIKQRYQIPKRVPAIRKSRRKIRDAETTDSEKEEVVENKSRVETRLNNILYDQELIQSVRELQENTGCEIEINPWGGVNVINDGVNLQDGVLIESDYNETEDNEQTECQIKIDHEVYNMDENVQYIIPDQGNILGVEFSGEGERVVYIDENDASMPEVHNTIEYDDTVIYEDDAEVANEVECGDDIHDVKQEAEVHTTEQNNSKEYRQVEYDFTDDENEYQMMYQYTNDEEHESEARTYDKESYYECRDVGIQADLPVIELEREYTKIRRLEAAVVQEDIGQSKYSYSSRSQPKTIMEEAIINRFNIEFYINQCGVSPCLENLAFNMGISVLALLKQLYQGEAVFKMTLGRSGRQNRKTVHLAHIPLTIAFPYDKFKYIHCLQEYKKICSKYSDVAMQLENTIQSISKTLEAKEAELNGIKTQHQDFSELNEKYENLLKSNELLEASLKKSQTELVETKKQNDVLTKKVKHLESLNISSRIKDAEILKQLLKPQDQEDINKVLKENKVLKFKIRELTEELEENSLDINDKLTDTIKQLESSLEAANADNATFKTKIRKIEQLYLTDSQSLLDKISSLEKQIEEYKTASNVNFAENASSLKLLANAELKCRKLEKQLKSLQESQSPENSEAINKTIAEEDTITRKRVYGTRSKQKIN